MPFITQCPHPDCGKFMLMEEETRGTTVPCLVCKQPIELEPIILDSPEEVPLAQPMPDPPSRFRVRDCPKCKRPIKVPHDNQAVNCPDCGFWGIVQ